MNIERPESSQPMPPHAKKVFSGIMFDVYQWEQKMFDGSTAIFEKLKRPDIVIVYPVLSNGKFLLNRQEQPGKKPFISAAGGRVEPDEDILDAAKRELLEETGYQAEEYILWDAQQTSSKIDCAVFTFVAKKCKKVADLNLDGGEKMDPFEVSFEEFLDIATQDDFVEKETVKKVLMAKLDAEKMEELKKLFSTT